MKLYNNFTLPLWGYIKADLVNLWLFLSMPGKEAFAAIREIVLNFPSETTSAVLDRLLSAFEIALPDLEEYEDLLTIVIREISKPHHSR